MNQKKIEMKLEALNVDDIQRDKLLKLAREDTLKAAELLSKLEYENAFAEKAEKLKVESGLSFDSFDSQSERQKQFIKKFKLT